MRQVWRVAAMLVCVLTASLLDAAQQQDVVVVRNVNLRPQPRADVDSIELYGPPTALTLVEPAKREGYFHVRDANGHEGWVWARNVRVGPPVAVPAHETVASKIDPAWNKPAPFSSTFSSDEGSCSAEGDGGDDISTNRRKNRADVPDSYHRVAFKALTRPNLPYPDAATHRDGDHGWTQDQLDDIEPFEGVPVTVEGYMLVVRKQTSGSGEATNCHHHHTANTDVHVAL